MVGEGFVTGVSPTYGMQTIAGSSDNASESEVKTCPTVLISAASSTHVISPPSKIDLSLLAPPNALQGIRDSVEGTLENRVEQLQADAKKASQAAKDAGLQLKKKTFIIKLGIAIVSSIILLASIAATAATAGMALPFTVAMGVIAVLAIADASCALADWLSTRAGHAGLPMGQWH